MSNRIGNHGRSLDDFEIHDSDRDRGHRREERKGQTEYPERDPLDLIDEDKRPFARRRVCQTWCGGFRTVYDDYEEMALHPGLHIVQIIIMLVPPTATYGIAVAISDCQLACTVAAVSAFGVVAILQTISFIMQAHDHGKQADGKKMDHVQVDLTDASDSFCSQASF